MARNRHIDVIRSIVNLMEDEGAMGNSPYDEANPMATGELDIMAVQSVEPACDEEPDNEHFTDDELLLGRKFIEKIGSAERVRSLIDKVDEYAEGLGILDTDEDRDADMINQISDATPDFSDFPTRAMQMATLYNPSGNQASY